MKLTNISLAILVALGLAACGGSDDNNDQTTDPKTPPKKEEPKKEETPTPTPPKSGLVPERAAPDMTVPDDIKNIVATRKTAYVDRTFTDDALGYYPGKSGGFDYEASAGTDPANIKLTSTYKFKDKRDFVKQGMGGTYYNEKSLGAIHVGEDPTSFNNNAFVMVSPGKYVRVAVKKTDVVVSGGAITKPYTKDTKFYAVKVGTSGFELDENKAYSQDDVVFIANAKTDNKYVGVLHDTKTEASPLILGDVAVELKPTGYNSEKDFYFYQPDANEVSLTKFKVFGQTYDVGINGQNVDFGKLKVEKAIQTEDITGTYEVRNGKDTATSNDDYSYTKSINLGKIKAYNLPYSIAFVTTNLDKDNPDVKPVFGLPSYQVLGFKTIALPKQGRALYTGKSFGPTTEGDVELIADFFSDRAGVSGSILNRKDKDGNTLANLTLDEISLTSPENHSTGGFGAVKGDPSYDVWAVNFYGQEAEEAAGYIGRTIQYAQKPNPAGAGSTPATIDDTTKPVGMETVHEVFNTQRGKLTNQSNTADVK